MGQNSATRHKEKNDRPGNQTNGTNVDSSVNFKFDDDAGLKIKQYTNELHDVHPDPDGLLPPTRPKKIRDSKYADALLGVVKNGDLVSLEMMLTGFDANIRDPQTGRIALSIAAETGNSQIAELLLKNGADVNNRQYSISGKPTRPTFQQEAIVLSGRTPLHWAIAKKHTDIVKLLLQHGANPNARNSAGRTVLQEACYTNHPESAELLLQSGADVNGLSLHSGWAPIHEAAACGKTVSLLRTLLKYKPLLDVPVTDPYKPGAAPVHFLVKGRRRIKLDELLSNRADPNTLMVEDISALHMASADGWEEGINILLYWNAAIDAQDQYLRETPLHKAARNNKTGAIKLLCEKNANQRIKNIDGMGFQEVLDLAQQRPDDRHISPNRESFCTFYIP